MACRRPPIHWTLFPQSITRDGCRRFSLSPEDLEDLENTRKGNLATYHADWYKKMKVKNPDERRAVNRKTQRPRYEQDLTKTLGKNQRHRDDNIAKNKYHCAVCNYSAAHKQNLDSHLTSKRHLKKVLLSSSEVPS